MQDSSSAASALDPTGLGRQLFEASPDCVKLLDGEGRIVAMNHNGLCAMRLGSLDDVRGRPWIAFWPAASRALIEAAMATARTGGIGRLRAACPTAAGDIKWWDVTVSPVGAGGLLATSRDISEQVAAELERERLLAQLKTANERMEDVFRQAPAFICVFTGPDLVFEMVNERYLQLVGGRNPVGLPLREALPELAGQGFVEVLQGVYRGGEPVFGTDVQVMLQRQPGAPLERRFVDQVYMPLRDHDGHISGILVHGIDVTDRKLAAEKLRASEERYRTLFESVDQGFCILEMIFDEDGRPVDYRFLEMNRMFEVHTGLVGGAGKTAREMVPTLDSFWFETYGRVAQTGEPVRFESEAPAMERWFDVYATRLGGPGSPRVALLFSDITSRKESEATLRKLASDLAEADRRKTEFLATLAHELRNPLAPIRSGLGVMRLKGDSPAAVARVREMMERQVGNMVHLIDDLLDIARISGGKLALKKERADLRSVLSSAVETSLPLVESGRHALTVDLPETEVPVEADVTRIAQVVSNLLNNAAKYTPAGGRIGLALRVEEDHAVVSVSDNGIGIPQDQLVSVFEMFSQVGHHTERSQGGLGIGLSLVRRLVNMHGGEVSAASGGPDTGSVFTVRLPLASGVQSGGGMAPAFERDGADGEGARILVVDDNVDAAVTLSMILDACGYTTRVAHDGAHAVELAAAFRPQVAFLDIGMPGMDGYQTARAMRQEAGLEHITLVALTGWGADSDRQQSSEAGFDHHLTKPVQLDVVQDLLAKLAA
ncbi:MAG: PAS domain-containing protein [Pseudomonadota bacterium]